ncbi:MAG: hypothetical protein ABL885_15540 [Methylophilaceae bacterium]
MSHNIRQDIDFKLIYNKNRKIALQLFTIKHPAASDGELNPQRLKNYVTANPRGWISPAHPLIADEMVDALGLSTLLSWSSLCGQIFCPHVYINHLRGQIRTFCPRNLTLKLCPITIISSGFYWCRFV